jgi:hypothetical protein
MARISSINRLPESVRSGLDEQIRRNGYCDMEALLDWLREQGAKISRSALGRYMLSLRAADSSLGVPRARLESIRRRIAPRSRTSLLEQLGRLELEKARLLVELMALAE